MLLGEARARTHWVQVESPITVVAGNNAEPEGEGSRGVISASAGTDSGQTGDQFGEGFAEVSQQGPESSGDQGSVIEH